MAALCSGCWWLREESLIFSPVWAFVSSNLCSKLFVTSYWSFRYIAFDLKFRFPPRSLICLLLFDCLEFALILLACLHEGSHATSAVWHVFQVSHLFYPNSHLRSSETVSLGLHLIPESVVVTVFPPETWKHDFGRWLWQMSPGWFIQFAQIDEDELRNSAIRFDIFIMFMLVVTWLLIS